MQEDIARACVVDKGQSPDQCLTEIEVGEGDEKRAIEGYALVGAPFRAVYEHVRNRNRVEPFDVFVLIAPEPETYMRPAKSPATDFEHLFDGFDFEAFLPKESIGGERRFPDECLRAGLQAGLMLNDPDLAPALFEETDWMRLFELFDAAHTKYTPVSELRSRMWEQIRRDDWHEIVDPDEDAGDETVDVDALIVATSDGDLEQARRLERYGWQHRDFLMWRWAMSVSLGMNTREGMYRREFEQAREASASE